jgi:undecaprenyl-diphosphatase
VLHRSHIRRAGASLTLALGALSVLLVTPAGAQASDAAREELTAGKAVVLGLVEGITEYLPISSTGHLHVTQRLLDIGTTPETEDAADTYVITIQAGAILAVLLLYWQRIVGMVAGALGRDPVGRRVFLAVVVACTPALVTALVFERPIKDTLLGAWPIVAAWLVGGVLIIVLSPRLHALGARGVPLDEITMRHAVIIGLAQILALWPGTSRSLVTIIAGVAAGLTIVAAVEFSFLLGFVTLSAATLYEAAQNGPGLVDTYGLLNPLIGFVVAFVAAAAAIKWMIRYLQRHDLAIFGWYRIAIAALTLLLLATDVI